MTQPKTGLSSNSRRQNAFRPERERQAGPFPEAGSFILGNPPLGEKSNVRDGARYGLEESAQSESDQQGDEKQEGAAEDGRCNIAFFDFLFEVNFFQKQVVDPLDDNDGNGDGYDGVNQPDEQHNGRGTSKGPIGRCEEAGHISI
jgi:hypothetical protein